LHGEGEATIEVRTDPTDPSGRIGAVILPIPKDIASVVRIPADYFPGMHLDQPIPAVLYTGQEILLKGRMDNQGLTQLSFQFSSVTEDTIRFFVSVDNGFFERSIVFNHAETGTYELDFFAGEKGESKSFIGDFRPIQVLPGVDEVGMPRRFFSGVLLDETVPTRIRSGEEILFSGVVTDQNLTRIVFDFIDQITGELVRKFAADIVSGRFARPIIFNHDEAGVYELEAFIGLRGQSLPFAGGLTTFQVLPGRGVSSYRPVSLKE